MLEVNFYDDVDEDLFKVAVILAKTKDSWVLCKHRDRTTYEVPGGHKEVGETILETAKRELYEETGAIDFKIMPICGYSIREDNHDLFYGMLYYATIESFADELHSEIEKIILTKHLHHPWTYPLMQPHLFTEAKRRGYI